MHHHSTPCVGYADMVLHGLPEIQTRHGVLDHNDIPDRDDYTGCDGSTEFPC